MHEGAVCREIMDIVEEIVVENDLHSIYEIVISAGPYSGLHEGQLNFYFEIARQGTCMENAVLRVEPDETLTGRQQMMIASIRGD